MAGEATAINAAAKALQAVEAATAQELLDSVAQTAGQGASQYADWARDLAFKRSSGAPISEWANTPVYRWNFDPSAIDALDKVVDQYSPENAWNAWKSGGGNVTPNGAASTPPSTKASPQTAIKKAGAAGASAGGLLSISLPTWVAAAAPLLGVGVGIGLYELSPSFWEKVSRKVLPFCYPDSQTMPVVTDEDGNTYIDKEAVEALKEAMEEEGVPIGEEGGKHATSELLPGVELPYLSNPVTDGGFQITGSGWFWNRNRTSVEWVTISDDGNLSYTYDGKTVRYGTHVLLGHQISGLPSGLDAGKAAWTAKYGTITELDYPEGTSKWSGNTVDIASLPVTQVYTDPADETKTRDYIPVALPTEPGQSLDPEENPDPTTNEDPEAQISPYIMPTIPSDQYPEGSESTGDEGQELDKNAPIPIPSPNPSSEPDPEANPNEEPEQPPQKLVDLIPPIDSGNILMPNMPGIGDPLNVDGGVGGLVSVYNPTYAELQAFSQWLWVTYADATQDKIWNNPFDGVISLHELYATPNKGARKNIKSGFLVSPVSCITIPNRYSEINCGTAIFPEYWGNYLDYSPYSKAMCYLPFIGIVELNVDDIVGHAVNITYRVDSYSGACIALITCAKEGSNAVLYQFSGNCSVQMPIAGGTQAAIKAAQISAGAYQNAYHVAGLAGLLGGVLGGVGSLLTGSISGAINGVMQAGASYATNKAWGKANYTSQTVSAKSSVQHSGQFGESFGAMGAKRPYMIVKRPVQVIVPNYQNEYGYQAHKYVTIGECEGYLRCRGVHVQSARATDAEKHAIEQMLMEGVYVT